MTALDGLRGDRRTRLLATAAAVVVGLGLATVHWAGLLVAGGAVALPQRSVPRGLAAGFSVGVLVVVAFLLSLAFAGTLGATLTMGQPSLLALGIGLLLPAFGSLIRGVV